MPAFSGKVITSLMEVGVIHVPSGYSAAETVNNKIEDIHLFRGCAPGCRVCPATEQLGVNLCSCKEGFVMEMLIDP